MSDILHRLHCTIRCDIETAASGCHCAEARDEIARLRAANERLRAALETISLMDKKHEHDLFSATQVARAALDGQPAPGKEVK